MARTAPTAPITTSPVAPAIALRPATAADIDTIADIWQRGWLDAHLGRVPAALLDYRRPEDFQALVPARLATTTVAERSSADGDAAILGFVTWHDDEIEQLYVDAPARGTGVAGALFAQGEAAISARFPRAWLAVVAGNARARRFYERSGWSDAGPYDYAARTTGETTVPVPVHRYEKSLR